MKRKMQTIISASAASILAFSALAQDTFNSTTGALQLEVTENTTTSLN